MPHVLLLTLLLHACTIMLYTQVEGEKAHHAVENIIAVVRDVVTIDDESALDNPFIAVPLFFAGQVLIRTSVGGYAEGGMEGVEASAGIGGGSEGVELVMGVFGRLKETWPGIAEMFLFLLRAEMAGEGSGLEKCRGYVEQQLREEERQRTAAGERVNGGVTEGTDAIVA